MATPDGETGVDDLRSNDQYVPSKVATVYVAYHLPQACFNFGEIGDGQRIRKLPFSRLGNDRGL